MSENGININNVIELCEIGLVVLGLLGIATIKLISFLEKRKLNKAQLEIIRSQSIFNNEIELNESQANGYHTNMN